MGPLVSVWFRVKQVLILWKELFLLLVLRYGSIFVASRIRKGAPVLGVTVKPTDGVDASTSALGANSNASMRCASATRIVT
jgi:hypothetical protein